MLFCLNHLGIRIRRRIHSRRHLGMVLVEDMVLDQELVDMEDMEVLVEREDMVELEDREVAYFQT